LTGVHPTEPANIRWVSDKLKVATDDRRVEKANQLIYQNAARCLDV